MNSELEIGSRRPRRLSEIWKLDRETNMVVALGLNGTVQLNAVGSAIWLLLDGEHTIEYIIEKLAGAYPDQDQGQLRKDLISFISYLSASGLVILDWRPLYGEGSKELLESAP